MTNDSDLNLKVSCCSKTFVVFVVVVVFIEQMN